MRRLFLASAGKRGSPAFAGGECARSFALDGNGEGACEMGSPFGIFCKQPFQARQFGGFECAKLDEVLTSRLGVGLDTGVEDDGGGSARAQSSDAHVKPLVCRDLTPADCLNCNAGLGFATVAKLGCNLVP